MRTRNVFWRVSLSNGDTFHEGNKPFQTVEGALSPWQRLLRYLETNKASITALALYTKAGHVYQLPSAGNRPRFHTTDSVEAPTGYRFFMTHKASFNAHGVVSEESAWVVIEAQYPSHALQIWSSPDGNTTWSAMIPNG